MLRLVVYSNLPKNIFLCPHDIIHQSVIILVLKVKTDILLICDRILIAFAMLFPFVEVNLCLPKTLILQIQSKPNADLMFHLWRVNKMSYLADLYVL